MRVEKGVHKSPPQFNDAAPAVSVQKSSVAGEGARKRSAGLPDEEGCVDDDDDDEDD